MVGRGSTLPTMVPGYTTHHGARVHYPPWEARRLSSHHGRLKGSLPTMVHRLGYPPWYTGWDTHHGTGRLAYPPWYWEASIPTRVYREDIPTRVYREDIPTRVYKEGYTHPGRVNLA